MRASPCSSAIPPPPGHHLSNSTDERKGTPELAGRHNVVRSVSSSGVAGGWLSGEVCHLPCLVISNEVLEALQGQLYHPLTQFYLSATFRLIYYGCKYIIYSGGLPKSCINLTIRLRL